ncbi:hypothetical protein HanIR_Chr03g0103801 [Helianthus annuus]|nr:hypothetical protein HanIR_Chr03g0103801 [Helianthus annuus]
MHIRFLLENPLTSNYFGVKRWHNQLPYLVVNTWIASLRSWLLDICRNRIFTLHHGMWLVHLNLPRSIHP